MHRRIDSADAAVEHGLVTIDHTTVIAQKQNTLFVNGLNIVLIGVWRIGHAQQGGVFRFVIIDEQIVFAISGRIHHIVFQQDGVNRTVGGEHHLLRVHEDRVVIIVEVVGEVLE